MRRLVSSGWCALALACGASPKPPGPPPPESFCPGAPGCEKGNDGAFSAGIAVIHWRSSLVQRLLPWGA